MISSVDYWFRHGPLRATMLDAQDDFAFEYAITEWQRKTDPVAPSGSGWTMLDWTREDYTENGLWRRPRLTPLVVCDRAHWKSIPDTCCFQDGQHFCRLCCPNREEHGRQRRERLTSALHEAIAELREGLGSEAETILREAMGASR